MTIRLQASTKLPTELGLFSINIYKNDNDEEITAICSGVVEKRCNLPVRIHSACFTSEVLGSLKCDCKQQLDYAMDYIAKHDGVVLYLPQEGRGIGLSNKIKAYSLQEQGYDTMQANELLGLPVDDRSYEDARDILHDLNINSIQLLTNNPLKLSQLSNLGIEVTGRLPVAIDANVHSVSYLETKRELMGHMLTTRMDAQLNITAQSTNRPLIHVNLALDDCANTAGTAGKAIPLSCQKDWQRVHELREKYCGVAVGANTWQMDKPRLTARTDILGREPVKQPARIIFAGHQDCHFATEEVQRSTFVIGAQELPRQTVDSIQQTAIKTLDHNLLQPLSELNALGISSMLVEGGLLLIKSFIKQRMVDLMTIYVKTDCITTAITAATTALPDLAADELEALTFGDGILLSSNFNAATDHHPQYGIAV